MIILRHKQKEFGKITKLLPKNIAKRIDTKTRPVKARIGNWRRNKSIEAEAEILNILEKEEALKKDLITGKKKIDYGPSNKNVDEKLLNDLKKKYKTKFIDRKYNRLSPPISSSSITDTKNKYAKMEVKHNIDPGLVKEINNVENKSIIIPGNPRTTSGIAHEGGHIENRWGGDKNKRKINSKDTPKRRTRFLEEVDFNNQINPIQHIRNLKDSKIILTEEKNATENGLKLLKEHGMNSYQLNQSKKALKESYKTYEDQAVKKRNHGVRSILQIPSRKHLTPKDKKVSIGGRRLYYGDKSKIKYDKSKRD